MAEDGRLIINTRIDLKKLVADLKEAEDKLKEADKKFITESKAAAKKIGLAFAAAGAASIKFGADFEQGIANASTLFGDVDVNADMLKSQLLDVSDATGALATELTTGLYSALSAGVPITEDATEATDFLNKSAKLAKGGFTDVNTAVTATAKVMNAYGLGLEDVDRIQGILIQTQNEGITTVGELGSVLSNVTGTAANLGVSFEQVGAALAVMTATGTQTGAATTSLNALLNELSTGGSKADIALRRATAGLKVFSAEEIRASKADFAAREKALSKSLSKQLNERRKTLGKERKLIQDNLRDELDLLRTNTDEEIRLATGAFEKKKELINQEFLERLKIIDEERFNRLKAIDDEIKGINDVTAQEEKALQEKEDQDRIIELTRRAEQAKTLEEQQTALNELSEFRAELERKALLEQRQAIIEGLQSQKDSINEEFDAKVEALKMEKMEKEKQNNEEFQAAKDLAKKTFEEQSKMIQELHAVKLEEFDEARDAEIERITEANDARLQGVKAANQAIIDGFTSIEGTQGFKDIIEDGGNIVDVLKMLAEQAEASGVPLESFFGSVEAKKAVFALISEDGEKFNDTLETMKDTTGEVDKAAEKAGNTTTNKFNMAINKAKNILIEFFDELKPVVDKLLEFVDALIEGDPKAQALAVVLGTLAILLGGAAIAAKVAVTGVNLWNVAAAVATGVTTALGAAIAFLTSPIGIAIAIIGALIAAAILIVSNWETIKEKTAEIWESIKLKAEEIWGTLTTWFTNLWTDIKNTAIKNVTALRDDVKKAWENIKQKTEEVFNGLKEFFGEVFDKIVEKVEEKINKVKELFESITSFIKNVFKGNWKEALKDLTDIFAKLFGELPGFTKIPINTVIGLINGFIKGVNKIKIPDWVPGLGGKNINIPLIPKLQRGGLAFGETLAVVGDNPGAATNPEVIAPLDQLQSMMMNMSGMGANNGLMVNLKAVLEVDGESLAEVNLKAQDDIITFL